MLARTCLRQALEELAAFNYEGPRYRRQTEVPLNDLLELIGSWVAEIEREETRDKGGAV